MYALDADGLVNTPLWHTSFIDPTAGTTNVPRGDSEGANDTGDIETEHGITGTPVIDQSTGTLYVVAKTREIVNGSTNYVYRLHALDIASGAEQFGGPTVIQASGFVALDESQRPGLLLSNGVVYVGFGSHGDNIAGHGWILGTRPPRWSKWWPTAQHRPGLVGAAALDSPAERWRPTRPETSTLTIIGTSVPPFFSMGISTTLRSRTPSKRFSCRTECRRRRRFRSPPRDTGIRERRWRFRQTAQAMESCGPWNGSG